jgi:hypothetical protein
MDCFVASLLAMAEAQLVAFALLTSVGFSM